MLLFTLTYLPISLYVNHCPEQSHLQFSRDCSVVDCKVSLISHLNFVRRG